MRTLVPCCLLLALLAAAAPLAAGGHTTSGVPRGDLSCQPEETLHSYFLSRLVPTLPQVPAPAAEKTRGYVFDLNIEDCRPATGPGSCGRYPWTDPYTNQGWCDGVHGDFDFEWEEGIGAAFLPGGPWAEDAICDYGLVAHHGPVPVIDDVISNPWAVPAFFWAADTGPLRIVPTSDPADVSVFTPGGDDLMCLTDGVMDRIQFCWLDLATRCEDVVGTGAMPAGVDGGYWAFPYSGAYTLNGNLGNYVTLAGTITG